ncbi:nuclear transport factor 2 family protein [Pasteurella oralis]|uniref:Nuclear transport factor 2 family protein n=1 Tax=Pasteurella oralis TaxID=1071947 RepID=A0ABW4NS30_9PAST
MKNEMMKVFNTYTQALASGDFAAAFACMADDIKWHMGGEGPLSGLVVGKSALQARLAEFVKCSNGTFRVVTHWAAYNDDFVAASVISSAQRSAQDRLNMPGIDLFKITDGKIQEVWTFAQFQDVEDQFWQQ